MQLSQKQKSLHEFFLEFLKFRFNFEHFQKKMALIATWLFAFKNMVFTVFLNCKYKTRQSSLCWFSFIPKYITYSLIARF